MRLDRTIEIGFTEVRWTEVPMTTHERIGLTVFKNCSRKANYRIIRSLGLRTSVRNRTVFEIDF
jgi:hypothetical protein